MSATGLDPGLARRLRDAGAHLTWSEAAGPGNGARLARLGDESTRVERREAPTGTTVEVGSGPVGAVVLLLEADRRGLPTALGSRRATPNGAFPDGSIVAAWGLTELAADARPTVRDLVALARYALP